MRRTLARTARDGERVECVGDAGQLVVRHDADSVADDVDQETTLAGVDRYLRRDPAQEPVARQKLASGLGDRRRAEEELQQ